MKGMEKLRAKTEYIRSSRVISAVSAVVLAFNTVLSTAGSEVRMNKFVISADKTTASSGDAVNVDVELFTDDMGVAGFTVDLHYDPDIMQPVLTDAVSDPDGNFYTITNYSYEIGVVRVVGACMTGDNLTADVPVLSADFTILDDASGSGGLWLDVDSVVMFDGDKYIETECFAPDRTSALQVSVAENAAAEEISVPVDVLLPEISVPAEEPVPAEETVPVEGSVRNEEPVTEKETVPETVPLYIGDGSDEAETDDDDSSSSSFSDTFVIVLEDPDTSEDDSAAEIDVIADDSASPETSVPVIDKKKALYHADSTMPSEQLYYSFNISDCIQDYDEMYDIRVRLRSSGFVNGCIGLMSNEGEWQSQLAQTESGSDEWYFTDLDPNSCWDQVFVQFFYLEDGSHCEIESVEFIPHSFRIPLY